MIAKPAGVPHAFWNASDKPARVLEISIPRLVAEHGLAAGQ